MRVPYTVNINTARAYQPVDRILSPGRNIRSEDFCWDVNIPEPLSTLCVRSIAVTWAAYPLYSEIHKCEDVDLLAESLSSDLAQNELAARVIRLEAFWKRAYKERWAHSHPQRHKCRTWLQIYMEKHVAETLENLDPGKGNQKMIENLQILCSLHVEELNITQLLPSNTLEPGHIPMSCFLECFPNLTKLHLTFSVKFLRSDFEFGCYDPTLSDIKDLAKGLANCSHLRYLKIYRTRLTGGTAFLFDSLLRCGLEELSLPHCYLGDEGAAHVASLVQSNLMLRHLELSDNEIGNIGGQLLASAIFDKPSEDAGELSLLSFSLRLNPIKDEAASKIFNGLASNRQMKSLDLSCCSLTSDIFGEFENYYKNNTNLESLNLSNNQLGTEYSELFLSKQLTNQQIRHFDLRVSGCNSELLKTVEKQLEDNRKRIEHTMSVGASRWRQGVRGRRRRT